MEHFTQQVGETAIENRKILDSSTLLRTPDLAGEVSGIAKKRRIKCPFPCSRYCAMDASHGRIVYADEKKLFTSIVPFPFLVFWLSKCFCI
jgi:hypothetical protein